MIKLNPLAVSNAALLAALDQGGWATKAELAEIAEVHPNNLARQIGALAKAGLIAEAEAGEGIPYPLTDEGRAQLAAIMRAEHGGERRRERGRCPLDKIRPNPANRSVRPDKVTELADTIEAAGDVLQPVILTPPDASGVRILIAGEHRWRAALQLQDEGRLPEALADGLPFREREAEPADQILIRIIENSARADLSPLEDADQLLALQDATGWSAREIAKKTGRSPEGRETGVRDVQLKIKIAREATDEARAAYAEHGSWDRLRESVQQPKDLSLGEQVAAAGAAVLAAGAPVLGDGDAANPSSTAAEDWIETEAVELGRLEVNFFQHYVSGAWRAVIRERRGATVFTHHGEGITNRTTALRLAYDQLRLSAGDSGLRPASRAGLSETLTIEERRWLDALQGPHVVNGHDWFNATTAGDWRVRLGFEDRKANHGAGVDRAAGTAPAASRSEADKAEPKKPEPDAPETEDPADRAAEAALAEVRRFLAQQAYARHDPFIGHEFSRLMRALDAPGWVAANDVLSDDELGCLVNSRDEVFAVVDPDGDLPPAQACGLALLIAWAVNRAMAAPDAGIDPEVEPAPEGETAAAGVLRTGRAVRDLMIAHYDTLKTDGGAEPIYRAFSDALHRLEREARTAVAPDVQAVSDPVATDGGWWEQAD